MAIDDLKVENANLKKLLSATDIFLNAVIHLSMENWEPALKARIESLTRDNRQLDDAYTKARILLDNELAELRAKNMQLEKEAEWLAEQVAILDFLYNSESDNEETMPKNAEEWRKAARNVVEQKSIEHGVKYE